MAGSAEVQIDGTVARVTLNRPEVHNAFNEGLIADLTSVFEGLASREDLRVIVLQGAGRSFCAGADVEWMSRMSQYSIEENRADAERMSVMFRAIDSSPLPVVARIQGAALGGGCGLVACADIAIATDTCMFGLTEVKLGIIPAVISPFVLSKIGPGHARALFLTGERISAARALSVGLVHHVVPVDQIDAAVQKVVDSLVTSGPAAVREAKAWISRIAAPPKEETIALAPAKIAQLRASEEGREGLQAFLEKRKPGWIQ